MTRLWPDGYGFTVRHAQYDMNMWDSILYTVLDNMDNKLVYTSYRQRPCTYRSYRTTQPAICMHRDVYLASVAFNNNSLACILYEATVTIVYVRALETINHQPRSKPLHALTQLVVCRVRGYALSIHVNWHMVSRLRVFVKIIIRLYNLYNKRTEFELYNICQTL